MIEEMIAVKYVRDTDQQTEHWRDGVRTRMSVSSLTGALQLTVFEQWCDPGHGAPLHIHAVEEVLRVNAGTAELSVEGDVQVVAAGESVIIPAGRPHGFTNTGEGVLHTQAILAAPIFEAHYLESGQDQRRWQPDATVAR
jgi:quercetin dioxygenase-like cupin family protein